MSGLLNDDIVVGLIGLPPAHLPQSRSYQFVSTFVCAVTPSSVQFLFFLHISHGTVVTPVKQNE